MASTENFLYDFKVALPLYVLDFFKTGRARKNANRMGDVLKSGIGRGRVAAIHSGTILILTERGQLT